MNPHTGELTRILGGEALPRGFDPLPSEYEAEALRRIKFAEAMNQTPRVNLRGPSDLARWARDRRKEKRKAKTAASSRRRNRK